MERKSLATAGALLCAAASIGSPVTAYATSLDYQYGASGYGGRGYAGYGSTCNHSARVYSWKAPKAPIVQESVKPGGLDKAPTPGANIDREDPERDPMQEPGFTEEDEIETGSLPKRPGGAGTKELKPSKSSAAPAVDRGKNERPKQASAGPVGPGSQLRAQAAASPKAEGARPPGAAAKPQPPVSQTAKAALPEGLRSQTTSISPDQFLERCTKAGGDASGNGDRGTTCQMPNGEKANCIWAEKGGRWLGSCIAREVN
jgi:hypothetical protein